MTKKARATKDPLGLATETISLILTLERGQKGVIAEMTAVNLLREILTPGTIRTIEQGIRTIRAGRVTVQVKESHNTKLARKVTLRGLTPKTGDVLTKAAVLATLAQVERMATEKGSGLLHCRVEGKDRLMNFSPPT